MIGNLDDFTNILTKNIHFNNSYGSDDEQLNRILKLQYDAPKKFKIRNIIPMDDRSFWIFYYGTFPEEKDYRKKK